MIPKKRIGDDLRFVWSSLNGGQPYFLEDKNLTLKKALRDQGIQEMLISTSHGQITNTAVFDCDFYDWMAGKNGGDTRFEEEFMADYSWREDFLSDLMSRVR